MIQLVAFDLDGTVLDPAGDPAPSALEALRRLVQQGRRIAAISGRSIRRSLHPFRDYPELIAAAHVCGYNGAAAAGPAVAGRRRLLFSQPLAPAVVDELLAHALAKGLELVYCTCEETPNGLREEYRYQQVPADPAWAAAWQSVGYVRDDHLYTRLAAGELPPPAKVMLFAGTRDPEAVLDQVRHRLGDRVYVAWAARELLEIMAPEVNKGAALRWLASALAVPLHQVLAIGDGNNDLPMLRAAGTGVLMGNAHDDVRQALQGTQVHLAPTFAADGFAATMADRVLS
jgi:hydroxymethylpyrimidine pyrophosphatase-like HAD family hydrolase